MTAEEQRIRDRDKDIKVAAPNRNPFKIIDNLEVILAKELEEYNKKNKIIVKSEETIPQEDLDQFMTREQYELIFDPKWIKDADLFLMKLK